jgi:hypothetical protein
MARMAQTMYTHVSKCKNDKIKYIKKRWWETDLRYSHGPGRL